MKVINCIPIPQLRCNAPGGCDNQRKHVVTIQRDNEPKYTSYHVCDGHLKILKDSES